jgi:predicted nucleotidyltransferase
MHVVTLSQRKKREAQRRGDAARAVMDRLRAYITTSGNVGRFIVFGSAVTKSMRHDSDFDVMIDFPPDRESAAWRVVEDACREADLPADILSTATTTSRFVEKILARAVEVIE